MRSDAEASCCDVGGQPMTADRLWCVRVIEELPVLNSPWRLYARSLVATSLRLISKVHGLCYTEQTYCSDLTSIFQLPSENKYSAVR